MWSNEQPSEELGLTVQNISPALAEKLDVESDQGVLITQVKRGSITDMANIKLGSIIW
jgi:serine protease Do